MATQIDPNAPVRPPPTSLVQTQSDGNPPTRPLPQRDVQSIDGNAPIAPTPVPSPSTPNPTATEPNRGLLAPQDDNVAKAVADASSDTSPLIRQAKQAGLDMANSRGLLNSSIAVGAAQGEAYKVATPIGQQQAQQAAARNLSAQQFGENLALGAQAQTSAEKIAAAAQAGETTRTGLGIASQEKLGQLSADTQTSIANLNIAASDRQQASDLLSRATLQAGQITSNEGLAKLQADTQTAIANLNVDASTKQQLTAIAAQAIAQQRDIANQQAGIDKQIGSNETIAKLDIGSKQALASLDADTQTKIAGMNVQANQQDKAVAAAASYTSIYQNMVDTITSNKDIPAATRDLYLANAKNVLDGGIKLVESMYNVNLDWSGIAAVKGTQATPAVSTGNKAQDQANAKAAAAAAANYGTGSTGLLTVPASSVGG